MIKRAITLIRARGISGLLRATESRLRTIMARPAESFLTNKNHFIDQSGIEIGGPSLVFSKRGIFPVYPLVGNLDNCNFHSKTVWEGNIAQGKTYRFSPKKPNGQQHILETTALSALPSNAYDFVLSSHMLEHTANPILALCEWRRLLKDNGTLVLLLPNKHFTFDHRRPITTMAHLIADFQSQVSEDDLTHLPEILALHDLARDPEAGDMEAFKLRSMRNLENRCLHHHVFDVQLAIDLVVYAGFRVKAAEEIHPHHLLLVAQKEAVLGSASDSLGLARNNR